MAAVTAETEKKQKEIEMLKRDKEIQVLRTSKERIIKNGFIIGFILVLIILILLFRRYL